MASQFTFHSDRPLDRSLVRVAEALKPGLVATEKSFRARIANLNLSRHQQKALAEITPGAAVRSVDHGLSPSDFFARASEAGRLLAMLNTRADQVVRALTEYEKAATPAYQLVQKTVCASFQKGALRKTKRVGGITRRYLSMGK